jgi:phospholipid transport system substrate-binding protein
MMNVLRLWQGLWLAGVLAVASQVSAAALTPTETVRQAVDAVLAVLKNDNLGREERWQDIGRIIDARFDFRSMSQSVLATNWREASKEEKRQFVEYFSQYLEDTYRTKIETYTDQRVEYVAEQVRRDRAIVDTEIVTARTRIPVTYRLKNNKGEWFAYDVVIEGVSLVSNYRSTFNAIVKAEGMDGLLTDLEGRIADYKAKHGGLPPSSAQQ